jgi:hypothetical protein
MRGRPSKRPALDGQQIATLRQDLALHTLWIPLQAAAEQSAYVLGHPSRGFSPPFDVRYDRNGAGFMSLHTRMVAAPDERELSVGLPRAWTGVLRARYRSLEAADVDPMALLLVRLMCEAPIQLVDAIMCGMAAQLVRDSGCRVSQVIRRCYFLMERILATHITSPAYDLGEMALWVWGQRYLQLHCHWELAVYHELGLPYISQQDDYNRITHLIPAQVWPRTADTAYRTELAQVYEAGMRVLKLSEVNSVRAQYHVVACEGIVYYSLLQYLHETGDFDTHKRLACVSRTFSICARWIKKNQATNGTVTPGMIRVAEIMPYRGVGTKQRQTSVIRAYNAASEVVSEEQRKVAVDPFRMHLRF